MQEGSKQRLAWDRVRRVVYIGNVLAVWWLFNEMQVNLFACHIQNLFDNSRLQNVRLVLPVMKLILFATYPSQKLLVCLRQRQHVMVISRGGGGE